MKHQTANAPASVNREEVSPPMTTRSVHVRDVPIATWRRARQNALLSGLKFKDYVTRLLAEGPVFPPEEKVFAGERLPVNGGNP